MHFHSLRITCPRHGPLSPYRDEIHVSYTPDFRAILPFPESLSNRIEPTDSFLCKLCLQSRRITFIPRTPPAQQHTTA